MEDLQLDPNAQVHQSCLGELQFGDYFFVINRNQVSSVRVYSVVVIKWQDIEGMFDSYEDFIEYCHSECERVPGSYFGDFQDIELNQHTFGTISEALTFVANTLKE